MNMKRIFIACVVTLFLVTLPTGILWSQTETEATGDTTIETFWQLTSYAGIFRWPLFLTFVLGLVVIIRQTVTLYIDWKKSSTFYYIDFKRYKDTNQISLLAKQHPSSAARLVEILLDTLKTYPDAAKFNEEHEKYTEVRKQIFSTFQNRMAFWSDTAGALGLLGTVWGMFITFFRGDMDQQAILSGMGIALITTLMGLVISIILNFCTTEVSSFFNRAQKYLSEISEKLWRYVIENNPSLVQVPAARSVAAPVMSSQQVKVKKPVTEKKDNVPIETESEQQEESVRYRLVSVSGDKQTTAINQKLMKPLTVECVQIRGKKEEKKSGEKILFESLNKMGIFDNGESIMDVHTDKYGRASVYFTPQKQNGSCQIQARHHEYPDDPVQFDLEIVSPEPADFRIKSGNNQSIQAGNKLPEPIVIEVVDDSDNGVPSCIVLFKVEMGGGKFENGKSEIEIETDSKGLASAAFTLGSAPGFNAVQVGIAQIEKKKITIQALGQ